MEGAGHGIVRKAGETHPTVRKERNLKDDGSTGLDHMRTTSPRQGRANMETNPPCNQPNAVTDRKYRKRHRGEKVRCMATNTVEVRTNRRRKQGNGVNWKLKAFPLVGSGNVPLSPEMGTEWNCSESC